MGIISSIKSIFSKPAPAPTYKDPGAGGAGAGTYYTPAPAPQSTPYTPAYSASGTPYFSTSSGGGDSSGGGGGYVAPSISGTTSTEGALKQSLPTELRNTSPQEVRARQSLPGRERTFTFRGGIEDPFLQTRQPSAKEEVLQMSLPESRIQTKQSFKENIFYESILGQRRAFEAAPELSPYGMSTPEGEVFFFIPDVERAKGVSQQAFAGLPRGEKIKLTAMGFLGGNQIRQADINTQLGVGKYKEDKTFKILGTDISLRQVIKAGQGFDLSPLGQTSFGKAQRQVSEDFIYGAIPKTKTEFAITAVSFGVGSAIGAGLRGGGALLRAGLPRAAPYIEKGVGVAAIAFATPFVVGKGAELYFSPNKAEVLGRTTREFGALGAGGYLGSRVTGLGIGFVRTRGLQEVPLGITAPEFTAGQQFPQIRRGQTAGQLKMEFFESVLPGELPQVPRGFSARPIPFVGGKVGTGKVRPGELEGGYFAPRVNPVFFRGAGYPKLFSFGEFGRLPTIERTTFQGIEFAPGVRAGQRGLRGGFSMPEQKNIQEALAGTGRGVIPFSKSEKELVLVSETFVTKPTKRFYYKDPLTKERVPIFERETIKTREFGGFGKQMRVKELTTTLPELPSIISSSRIAGGSFISNYRKGSSALRSSLRSSYSKISSSLSNVSSGISSGYSSSGLSSSKISRALSSGYGGSSFTSYSSQFSSITSPPPMPLLFPLLGQEGRGKYKKAKRGFVFTPSLGVVLGKEFGLNIRGFGEGFASQTGLFERQFRKGIKLPTII